MSRFRYKYIVFGVDFLFNFLLNRGEGCSVGGRSGFCRGLMVGFVILSFVSGFIVGSESFVTFDFFFCTAFDQKLVILDYFVNDKVFHSFAYLLTSSSSSSLQGNLPSFFAKYFLWQFRQCSYSSLDEVFRMLQLKF